MNNLNMGELSAKLQQLQNQVAQFNQLQEQSNTGAQQPTYPRTIKTDTVEDILSNPQWRNELQTEFKDSAFGKKAASYADMLFAEFCSHATGKPSIMLDGLRKNVEEFEKKGAKGNGQTGDKNTKGNSGAAGGGNAGETNK